ncbi:hypothetical protein OG312_00395 [Kocuria rhizophila]|uniref:hypothetical protein n=1 Tax=Kocuria rhizophila TaxID=72000 RepID=UPI000F541CB7|nr:hypothetical protein [Kocuria rhizophila]MXN61678.1 hypothetical protein [Bacillus sp. BGMRC0062]WSQ05175.1 hypothetical protein OG312_00395 [Kocuria rhizophila]
MASPLPGSVPPNAQIPVLITYSSSTGLQLPLPQATMRESFTGLQMLSHHLFAPSTVALEGYQHDFTIMQMGPSAFEIEIRASVLRSTRRRGRTAAKNHLRTAGILERLADMMIGVGELACFIANHPDVQVRYVDGCSGQYYEFLVDGEVVRAMEARAVELLTTPPLQESMRAILANLKQPGVAYCTLAKRIAGVDYMRRVVIPASDHLRSFANGGPFPLSAEDLAEARARVEPARAEQWEVVPSSKNPYGVWELI